MDNLVLLREGAVAAVLDWELCTLGDPLADLGMLILYWASPGEDTDALLSGTPTAIPGFADRSSASTVRGAIRKRRLAGRVLHGVRAMELACIAEGIVARSRAGAMGPGQEESADWLAARVPLLAERAQSLLDGDPPIAGSTTPAGSSSAEHSD